MLMNWGSWFGIDHDNDKEKEVDESEENKLDDVNVGETEQIVEAGNDSDTQIFPKSTGFGGYIFDFASSASKKLSESVVEKAQNLKKSVKEGKLNDIFDKTILGDFQEEQNKFVEEQKAKKLNAAEPPWVGYNDEETIQEQILALSTDKRNFLRNPPAGVNFHFDFDEIYPVAMVMLEEDELLSKMRFHLVPKQVKEEVFWRNYFYRVSLIKQSAQLTALATQQTEKLVQPPQKDVIEHPPSTGFENPKPNEDEEISTSPPEAEFISDSLDSFKINEDDLRKGMEHLVLDQRENPNSQEEEMADWERELQEELQDYNVSADNKNQDENWDKEIEEMLEKDN